MNIFKLKKKIGSKKGASLVEVLVAAAIIVLAFTGLLQVFLYSGVLAEMSGNITLAVQEAQSKIEEIRSHDFDSISTDYGGGGTPGNTFTSALQNGTGAVTITAVNADLLNVSVTVDWAERNGRTMTTSLATLLARRN